ncbi:MAG: cell division protein SepF [Candidatus Bruticola sp.]
MSGSFIDRFFHSFKGIGGEHIGDTKEALKAAVDGDEVKSTEVHEAVKGTSDLVSASKLETDKKTEIVIFNVDCVNSEGKGVWCLRIAKEIREGKCVFINFKETSKEIRTRILDFLAGSIYVTKGGFVKLTPSLVLCYPSKVEVYYFDYLSNEVKLNSVSDSKVREWSDSGTAESRRNADYSWRERYK